MRRRRRRGRPERVADRDDLRRRSAASSSTGSQRRQVLRVDHQHLRAGVVTDVADLLGGQPVLTATRTAPASGTPKLATSISGMFGHM